jgi:ribosomal-protein-alanine N-acetyltransferase
MASTQFMVGNGFFLRELRESDLEGTWYQWFNDSEVTRFQNKKIFPNSPEKQRGYFESLITSQSDVVLAMVEETSNKHIGNVGLHKIDWVHRSAELGIVIGEKESWGKGFGKQAWKLITGYGFHVLNLHRIYAWVMAGNDASLRCAEEAGFKQEGFVRQMFYKEGRYVDGHYMNVLRSDHDRI